MHTVTLKIGDSIYSQVMHLLKNLNENDLEIVEEGKVNTNKKTKQNIKQLFKTKEIEVFKSIDNPLSWQEKQREEW